MKRSVSIEDVARAARVSHSTVSRALRNSPLISAEVRERVQQIAREMGYIPNAIAQSLKHRRTDTIGLVATSIADPFFADVTKGVEETARRAGLSVFLSATYSDEAQELAAIETFHRRQVDGLILVSLPLSERHHERLRRLGVPAVLVNTQLPNVGRELVSVVVDDYGGAIQAVDHLIGLGPRRIGYLGTASRPRSNMRRRAGYEDSLRAAGLAPAPELVVEAATPNPDDDVQMGAALLPELLGAAPSAIFCYNDMLAIGALLACRRLGISVPGQLSLIGFDDVATAGYVTPALSTVRQPRRDLGRTAMQMLLDLLAERPVEPQVLSTTLVPRESTAPPQVQS